MPKISRIRIINFSYNSDKRLILDELFNLHQGEDALISLKNGGGKSVLVQALIQPILPRASLQDRKISDFFIKKRQPAYILIEWKLDDNGGNLLTGIGMVSKESGMQDLDEGSQTVKYFTFLSHYRNSGPMDIRHIELAGKEQNRVIVKGYSDAQKYIQEAAKKQGQSVAYFSEYDRKDHQEALESYNIHPDEWKTVLLPLNSEEGGLIKIFEKCRTSRLLLRDWILNTVNKVIHDDQKDAMSLTEIMGHLAQSMIDNEAFILERDLLKSFSERLSVLSEMTCRAAGIQSDRIEREESLRSLGEFLKSETERLEDEREHSTAALDKKRRDLLRIEQERLSERIHIDAAELGRLNLLAEEKNEEHELSLQALEKTRRRIQILEARQLHDEIQKLLSRKAEIETDLARLDNPSEDQERMDRIAYSLKIAYEKEYQVLAEKRELLKKRLSEMKHRMEEARRELKEHREAEKTAIAGKERCISSIRNYEEKEKELLDRTGLVIRRNLMKGLVQSSADELIQLLEEELLKLQEAFKRVDKDIEEAKTTEDTVRQEIPRIHFETEKTREHLARQKEEIRNFDGAEAQLMTILRRYDISSTRRYQKDAILPVLKDLLESGQERLDAAKDRIKSLEQRKFAMESGILHVSRDFYDHLENSDIEFDTGEHYLNSHPIEIRKGLLEKNPLLPYSFLMTLEELERVKGLKLKNPLLQPVPILTYDRVSEGTETLTSLGKGGLILVDPDLRLFETDGTESYQQELERMLQEERSSRAHYHEYVKELRESEQYVIDFAYPESYRRDSEKTVQELEERIHDLEGRSEDLIRQHGELKDLLVQLDAEKLERGRLLDKTKETSLELNSHLSKNSDYEKNNQLKQTLEMELLERQNAQLQLDQELTEIQEEALESDKEISILEIDRGKIDSERQLFIQAAEKPLEEGSLEQLLAIYRKLKADLSGTIENLERDLSRVLQEITGKERMLERKAVSHDEYLTVRYHEGDFDELLTVKDKQAEVVKVKDRAAKDAATNAAALSGSLSSKEQDLKARGILLLPQEEILGSYQDRETVCRQLMRKLEELLSHLEKTMRSYGEIQGKIQHKLRQSQFVEAAKEWDSEKDPLEAFTGLMDALDELNAKLKSEELSITQNFRNLKDDYRGKHQQLTSLLVSQEKMHSDSERDPEKYYYFYENLEVQLEGLRNLIRIQEMQLENMEKSFNDAVVQSYHRAKDIYDHVNRVADDSRIQLDHKKHKVKMIEILLKELEPEEKGFDAMRSHIQKVAEDVKEQLQSGKTRKEVKDLISKSMSSEELLNVISDLSDLRIKAYKVDINAQNSKAKDWEKVMKENSGGERFVSFFAVMVALMSYARNAKGTTDDYSRRNTDSKVLLMDNPFGPISSEHLLKPLFDIARKYNTQLICLTDLKQNSIINQFNVIFMMKIIPNVSGTMEYLKVEETSQFDEGSEENLEMLNFYQKEEQISMLDI